MNATLQSPHAPDRRTLRRLVPIAGALGAIGIVSGAMAAAASPANAGKAELVVKTAMNAKLGDILVTTKGFTLYRYTPDTATKVACTGSCAAYWPPLVLTGGAVVPTGTGVTGLGTIKDPNGKLQVTYKGHPLYTYKGDTAPGTTNGQGVLKTWYAVTVSVPRLTAKTSRSSGSGATSTTKASGSGGYGY